VLPCRVAVWAVGLELLTRRLEGEDLSGLNKFR
jgi:hypothetical protein